MNSLGTIAAGMAVLLVGVIVAGALAYGLYRLMSLPLRRREQERWLLDVIETAIQRGHSPEQAIKQLTLGGEQALGRRFAPVAAQVRRGGRLAAALARAPGLCSVRCAAMLAAGERLGDLRRVLPACRAALADAPGQVLGASNYLMLWPLLWGAPGVLLGFWAVVLLPKFREIFLDLTGGSLPPLLEWLSRYQGIIGASLIAMSLTVLPAVAGYAFGPYLHGAFGRWGDRWLLWLPWQRQRVQRDFAALLAVLLDQEVPEAEAVRLAAAGTGNLEYQARADRVVMALAAGASLPVALQAVDDAGELRWRLENAARGGGGFQAALAGWQESLGGRAFQSEQTVAQLLTTSLVVVNGVVVGIIAVGVFQAFTNIVREAALW